MPTANTLLLNYTSQYLCLNQRLNKNISASQLPLSLGISYRSTEAVRAGELTGSRSSSSRPAAAAMSTMRFCREW